MYLATGYQTAAGASGSQHPTERELTQLVLSDMVQNTHRGMVIRKLGTLGPLSQGMKGEYGQSLSPSWKISEEVQAWLSFELKFLPELQGPLSGEDWTERATALS